MNPLNHELIETERRKDRLAEAAHYRLIIESKEQNMTLIVPRLLTSLGHLLEGLGCWLLERNKLSAASNPNNQTS